MGSVVSFDCQSGLSKYSWLYTPEEMTRYNLLVARFQRENPQANEFQIMTAQRLFEIHIMIGRLFDRKTFFNGETPHYVKSPDRKRLQLDPEDSKRKQAEFDRWYMQLQKEQREWTKVALANSLEVNLTTDIPSLFGALDADSRKRLNQYKANGEAKAQSN